MMPTDRFERQLPVLLDELAQPRTPDYFDDLLGQTARTRQRPAWTFPERWIPMLDIARQPVLTRPVPWRPIVALALLALLILATALFYAGSHRVPAPFGLARNGLVAYAKDGDIYTADPVTGVAIAVVTGPETDMRPIWSRDGTRFAFERKLGGESSPGQLLVANADGTRLTTVTPEPIVGIASYDFSPDGREILVEGPEPVGALFIAKVDGSGIRPLETGLPAGEASWRPPDGAEILFRGGDTASPDALGGLYAVDVDSGAIRPIREPSAGRHPAHAMWSPDGSHIAYYQWVDSGTGMPETHIIAADGTGDRLTAMPPDAVWEAPLAWSNDGSRLISRRGFTGGFEDVRVVVVPADGSNLGIDTDVPGTINGGCCTSWQWAPDDSSVLGNPADAAGVAMAQVLVDPATGTSRPMPWTTVSSPAWQRLAP